MNKITPFLWFDNNAEEAINFYLETFPNAKLIDKQYAEGKLLIGMLELEGQELTLMNGGPYQKLSPAFSFVIRCKDQAEVDYYWDKLLEGGAPSQCGWLEDKFGLSWQVTPVALYEYMSDPDPVKVGRTVQAMLGMVKLDIAGLKSAYDGV